MKNFFENIIDKKNELLQNISEKKEKYSDEEFDLYQYLLENGKILYLPENFNIELFTIGLKKYMQTKLLLKTETSIIEKDIYKIEYSDAKGIKKTLGVSGKFDLFLLQFEKELLYIIRSENWIENPFEKESQINFTSLFSDAYEKEIIEFTEKNILNEVFVIEEKNKINSKNRYIQNIPLNQKIWFYSVREKEEIMLAKLNISALKEYEKPEFIEKKLDLIFIMTNINLILAGFDNKGEIILFQKISGENFEIKRGIIKNEITTENAKFQVERVVAKLFYESKNAIKFKENERIREIARLNYLNKNVEYAITGLEYIEKIENNPYDKLCKYYINLKDKKEEANKFNQDKVTAVLNEIINDEKTREHLSDLSEKWKFTYTDKTLILQLMSNITKTKEQKLNILSFYDDVRNEFLKKNKDLINKTLFEINYCKFLIDCEENKNAVKILNRLLKTLPDESISDLLPSENTDLTSDSGGQLLKISVLDLLIKAQNDDKAEKYILKTAQLQPLNSNRLKALSDNSEDNLSENAAVLLNLFSPGNMAGNAEEIINIECKQLNNNDIETKLKHPAVQKQGSFYSFQKWLSKVKQDDYSTVKTFSEKLSPETHNIIYKNIKEIKKIFGIEKLEVYFARGEKSIGIRGYEGEPPFIIIGFEHINKESDYFMNTGEMQFAIGEETAHIFFNHSKITSNDIWRGVADKGYLFLDTLFSIVPVAGIIGKSISNISKLQGLSKLLVKVEKLSAGGDILGSALTMNGFYQKIAPSGKKKEQTHKLLAVSRLMQFTADRTGLLFSGDLKASVRAILLSGKNNFKYLDEINKIGLHAFLTEQNNDGTYKHQDIAIRFANLFSFYISNDFVELRKKIKS